jgi:alpha-galactosidase
MQSTSDQQDFLKYPPIAAAAPASILPEQTASWAYPQPEMTDEEAAFCLATGLLGRYYVSGHLGRMDAGRLGLVADAVAAAKSLRGDLLASTPFWPLGIPAWDAPWTALGLAVNGGALLTVWNRDPAAGAIELDLDRFTGSDLTVTTIFPRSLPEWSTHWDAETGRLRVAGPADEAGARVLRLQAVGRTAPGVPSPTATHSATRTQWR